jgi:hypothetical protein
VMSSEISSTAQAVNPPDQAKQREHRLRLEWCMGAAEPNRCWTNAVPGRPGRYTVQRMQAVWCVIFHRRSRVEVVGTADSLTEAKYLAERHLLRAK